MSTVITLLGIKTPIPLSIDSLLDLKCNLSISKSCLQNVSGLKLDLRIFSLPHDIIFEPVNPRVQYWHGGGLAPQSVQGSAHYAQLGVGQPIAGQCERGRGQAGVLRGENCHQPQGRQVGHGYGAQHSVTWRGVTQMHEILILIVLWILLLCFLKWLQSYSKL